MQPVNEYRFSVSLVRNAAIFSVVLLSISSALCAASWMFYSSKQHSLVQLATELRSVRQQVNENRSLERMIDNYHARFNELEAQEYFSQDGKLLWLEKIEESAALFGLFETQYVLGKRTREIQGDSGAQSDLGIYATPVVLEFGLLHEGDLLGVFEFLREQPLGLFGVNGCSLERIADQVSLDYLQALVNVRCELTSYGFIFNDQSIQDMENDYAMVSY